MDCFWCGEHCAGRCDKRLTWGASPTVYESAHGLAMRPQDDRFSDQELDAAVRALDAERREVERMQSAQRDHERLLALREEQLVVREQELARRSAELDARARRLLDLDHRLRTWAEAHDLTNADALPIRDHIDRGTRVS